MAKRKKNKHKLLGHRADTIIIDEFDLGFPRKGAPENLRGGGPHQDKKQKEINKILKKEIQDEQDSNS